MNNENSPFDGIGLKICSDLFLHGKDIATEKLNATLEGHTGVVDSLDFGPDSKTLASGSFDKSIKLWDITTGKSTATLEGHKASILSVKFSPDAKMLFSGSFDGTIKIWDLPETKKK